MDFWMVSAAGSKYSAEGRQLYKLSQAKAFAVNVQRVHATFSMLHLLARFSRYPFSISSSPAHAVCV